MNLDAVGCTANLVFVDKSKKKIYVANAGDSRCIMGVDGKMQELSFDHKPTNKEEKDRIEKAGSEVNAEGRVDGNLNLSRSLGDLKYKQKKDFSPEEQPITANPDTYVYDLDDKTDFILMGCDGIWEKNSNQEAADWIYDRIKGKAVKDLDLKQITQDYLHFNLAEDVQQSCK